MRILRRIAVLAAAFAVLATLPAAAQAAKPTVVLVHGAFADASGWYGVQERLEDKGYKVISPPTRCAASPPTPPTSRAC